MSGRTILVWTIWVGLTTGTLELFVFWLKCHSIDPRNMNVSRHLFWMFPLAGLLVIACPGLLLCVASRFWARAGRSFFVLFVLFFGLYVGLAFRFPVYTSVCLLLAAGLAWRSAGFMAKRENAASEWVGRKLPWPLALIAVVSLSCVAREAWSGATKLTSTESKPIIGKPRNVILVVMDTVRAKSLGLYGYPRPTTPQLSRFSRQGIRYDRAFSTAPWTAPSHASLFTGRWPHELTIGWDRPLDITFPTLAEVLGSRHYATAGFVANTTYCGYETGLDRGFSHYEDYDVTLRGIFLCSSVIERTLNFLHKHPSLARALGEDGSSSGDRKSASRINRDFLSWLDRQPSDRPFFAFLNYYDAHHPYLLPEPERDPGFGRKATSSRDFRLLKTWWERDKEGMKPEDLALARDSYDQCIASLDDQIGRLLDELARRGTLQDSIVIVTADHGEHLGEHNLFGHGCSLYRPELQVPLLLLAPGLVPENQVIADPVSLRDVPATVMDLLGLGSRSVFPGRSLVGVREPDRSSILVRSEVQSAPDDDPNGGRSPAARGPMISLVSKDHHYIRDGNGHEELFDLNADPVEVLDLSTRSEMISILKRFREDARK